MGFNEGATGAGSEIGHPDYLQEDVVADSDMLLASGADPVTDSKYGTDLEVCDGGGISSEVETVNDGDLLLDDHDDESAPASDHKKVPRGPLAPFVIRAVDELRQSHFGGDLPVQTRTHGFGGTAYLRSGDRLQFHDTPPGLSYHELDRANRRGQGFSDEDINSGISSIISRPGTSNEVTGRVFIAGLLDDSRPGVRVLREQADGQCIDSDLRREEKTAIVRLAFISQLIGYVSDRYDDIDSGYDAANAFIDDLETEGNLDGNYLKNMLSAVPLPGRKPQQLTTPTIARELTRFDDLITNYRWRITKINDHYSSSELVESLRLVQKGEYFSRVITSLGFDNRGLESAETASPLAIEPVK